jgi:hypothetical protein
VRWQKRNGSSAANQQFPVLRIGNTGVGGGVEMFFISSGKMEGSDSQGEGLRKILYQAYHMLKKVEFAQMLT